MKKRTSRRTSLGAVRHAYIVDVWGHGRTPRSTEHSSLASAMREARRAGFRPAVVWKRRRSGDFSPVAVVIEGAILR